MPDNDASHFLASGYVQAALEVFAGRLSEAFRPDPEGLRPLRFLREVHLDRRNAFEDAACHRLQEIVRPWRPQFLPGVDNVVKAFREAERSSIISTKQP